MFFFFCLCSDHFFITIITDITILLIFSDHSFLPSYCSRCLLALPIAASSCPSYPSLSPFLSLPLMSSSSSLYTFLVRSNQPDRAPWPPFHCHFTSGRVGTPITDAAFMRPRYARLVDASTDLCFCNSPVFSVLIFLASLIMLFSVSTVNSIHRCVMIQELRRCPESNCQAETRDLPHGIACPCIDWASVRANFT